MIRPLSMALIATGLAAGISLACEEPSGPAPGSLPTSGAPIPSQVSPAPRLEEQRSGTTNRLQAVSPVNANVVWASGVGGTFAVTVDGGTHWRTGVVQGADSLEFRDVQGVSADEAYLLSAGPGINSRIYMTINGGRSWTQQFRNFDPKAFYDCFAFWTAERGLVFSDAVDGRFPMIRTSNGRTWTDIGTRAPAAQAGEAGFAASGTCVATQGEQNAWIATGGAAKARILATTDGGDSWQAYDTPIVQGTQTSGGFSVAFRDAAHGILAGGDLGNSGPAVNNVAVTDDGGKSWQLRAATPFAGAAFGLSYVPDLQTTVVVTGPSGAAWSKDEGTSWQLLPALTGFWAVGFAGRDGWLVGTEGRIEKISF
jgi:photosystem II stability/assembly factor-like uncharacterized protein